MVYHPLDDEAAKMVFDAFTAKSGIKIRTIRKSAGNLAKLIEVQKDAPQASVMFGGSIPAYESAKENGLLEAYKSPVAEKYSPRFKDPDGYWTGIYVGAIGFAVNTNIVNVPVKSWQDLLKPELKRQVCYANPAASGTAYTIQLAILKLMGKDDGYTFMKKLNKNVVMYTNSGSQPAGLAGMGVCGIGIAFAHDILKKTKGKPVKLVFPTEGTGWEIGGVALVKNCPNVVEAKKFIDFVLSKELQNLYGTGKLSPRFSTNPDAIHPKGTVALSTIKLVDLDFVRAGKDRTKLTNEWNRIVPVGD